MVLWLARCVLFRSPISLFLSAICLVILLILSNVSDSLAEENCLISASCWDRDDRVFTDQSNVARSRHQAMMPWNEERREANPRLLLPL